MFKDRREAGKLLAERLLEYKDMKDSIVLAIPRGGVEVAFEVAKRLGLPLDVVMIKKIGFPGNDELAVGAVGVDTYFLNDDVAASVSDQYIQEQVKLKQQEAKQKYELLRGSKPMYSIKDKTVLIIDDGIATGASVIMASQVVRKQQPAKIVVAVPVSPPETAKNLEHYADLVVCLEKPAFFLGVGDFYQDFSQVEDEECRRLLKEAEGWLK